MTGQEAAALVSPTEPTAAPIKPAVAPPKDDRPWEARIEKALDSENPKAAVEQIAAEYMNDFTNVVRCQLSGQPNSPAHVRGQMLRNACALGVLGILMATENTKLLAILAKAVNKAK